MLKSENQNKEELSVDDNVFLDNLNQSDIPQTKVDQLSRSQKIAVAVLAFFALLIFVFWMSQFSKNINSPFRYSENTKSSTQSQVVNSSVSEDDLLKEKDTDNDGLKDWDELNIYKTSPYLEDSDSDGFSDSEEIANDKDPTCPAGRDCGTNELQNVSVDNLTEVVDVNSSVQSTESVSGDMTEQSAQNILSGQGDATALRELLISSGMDKSMLDQISDDELMEFYRETLSGN